MINDFINRILHINTKHILNKIQERKKTETDDIKEINQILKV